MLVKRSVAIKQPFTCGLLREISILKIVNSDFHVGDGLSSASAAPNQLSAGSTFSSGGSVGRFIWETRNNV